MRTMVRAAIRDIEAVRAGLPLDQRHHSEIVLRHLNRALGDLAAPGDPAAPSTGVVVRLDLVAARRAGRAQRALPASRAER
jgi:hypothetical protein